jgi:iron complex outermembrane receptor protein
VLVGIAQGAWPDLNHHYKIRGSLEMIKSKLTVAVLAALVLGYTTAHAQSAQSDTAQQSTDQTPDVTKATKLEAVTVAGSLIPQTQIETATPTVTITADQLKSRGFATVAQALQQSSNAVGSVTGPEAAGTFTQGAQTLSLFGLQPGYVKYLIDGIPMGNFPALYNGSDVFNNLSSIPIEMVDHIDILPGGQSSLYGSDAIAGVINIVLKKKLDAPVLDVRYGWNSNGGGAARRVYLADSFNVGKFNLLAGVQFESTQPIWSYDRPLTAQANLDAVGGPIAERDYLDTDPTADIDGYRFADPNNCANTTAGFGGTTGYRYRPNSGNYCGSYYGEEAYTTLANESKTANLYSRATFDVNDNLQLYSNLLYNYQEQKYQPGGAIDWLTSSSDSNLTFYDPIRAQYTDLQRIFSPEEVGGYENSMNKQIENSYMFSLGGKGTFAQSNWDYDLGFTHSNDQTDERDYVAFTNPINTFFTNRVLGPDLTSALGPDPLGYGVPVFEPNYAAFYTPITPAEYRSFTGYATTLGKTWDNMLRGQVTNASLFTLPGGDAGLAVVLEGGNQGWAYVPDPGYFNGDIYDYTADQGAGHRSRYAATTELNFPLLQQLTVDVSGRQDAYEVSGGQVKHNTYSVSLEYRPFDSLLLRGKYGTAFKVPTLADEYSGTSGYYSSVTDYYNCALLGDTGPKLSQCPGVYSQASYFNSTSGNVKLKPITATNWNYGLVWAPISKLSVTIDYLHFDIRNEVGTVPPNTISQENALCLLGTLNPTTPSCINAINAITRNQFGAIEDIYTPNQNIARERVNAITANLNYQVGIGAYGSLSLSGGYSDELRHDEQPFAGDPFINYLDSPLYSTDFKTKANASVTWSVGDWATTLYVNRDGRTPNYLATVNNNYSSPGTGYVGAWITYNASVQYNPMKNLTLSFLVNNLFNNMPPVDNSYPGYVFGPYNSANYSVYGRQMYVEATYKFGNGTGK